MSAAGESALTVVEGAACLRMLDAAAVWRHDLAKDKMKALARIAAWK